MKGSSDLKGSVLSVRMIEISVNVNETIVEIQIGFKTRNRLKIFNIAMSVIFIVRGG